MNTLLVVSLSAAAASAAVFIWTREKAKPAIEPSMPPAPHYGESTVVSVPVPSGWRRASNSEVLALPELGTMANALRSTPGFTQMPYGTFAPFVASDGSMYATWIEQHYHPPGGPQPWGYHHGVTILAKIEQPVIVGWF